jgi:phage virion morphogenesis protein
MSGRVAFTINDQKLRLALKNFVARIGPEPLLRAAGAVMMGSIMQTFRDEGSPAGSWAPLAEGTLRTRYGRMRPSKRARLVAGKKLLIESGRLRRSITYEVDGNTLRIGTDVIYGRIHQLGGMAGRGRKVHIPARPYLVFRPEDPERIAKAMNEAIDDAIEREGLQ